MLSQQMPPEQAGVLYAMGMQLRAPGQDLDSSGIYINWLDLLAVLLALHHCCWKSTCWSGQTTQRWWCMLHATHQVATIRQSQLCSRHARPASPVLSISLGCIRVKKGAAAIDIPLGKMEWSSVPPSTEVYMTYTERWEKAVVVVVFIGIPLCQSVLK